MKRTTKQFLYSFVYLFICFILFFGFWNFITKKDPTCFDGLKNQNETKIDCGGVCVSCDLKNIKQVELLGFSPMKLQSEKTSLLIHIKNPNETHHAFPLLYNIKLLDEDGLERESFTGSASIEAGADAYILEQDVRYSEPHTVVLETTDVDWKLKEEISFTEINVQDVKNLINGNTLKVVGTIENTGSLEIKKIHIIAVIRGEYDEDVYASETVFTRLLPFRKEDFSIFFPSDAEIIKRLKSGTTRVIVQVE